MENLADLLREEIGKVSPKDREGRTWGELIVQATLLLAMKGNATALKILWHYLSDYNNGDGEDRVDLSSFTDEELLMLREMLDVVEHGGLKEETGPGDQQARLADQETGG